MLSLSTSAVAAQSQLQQTVHAIQGMGTQTLPPPAPAEIAFSPDASATDLVIEAIHAAKIHSRGGLLFFLALHHGGVDGGTKSGVAVKIVIDQEEV